MAANGDGLVERFKVFAMFFVEYLEKTLFRYAEESYGWTSKTSWRALKHIRTALIAGGAAAMGVSGLGVPVVAIGTAMVAGGVEGTSALVKIPCVRKGLRYVGEKMGIKPHAKRADAITAKLTLPMAEMDDRSITLAKVMMAIFHSHEMQFVTVKAEFFHNAMNGVAKAAVDRIVNFCEKNPKAEITPDFLLKAFVQGKKKKSSKEIQMISLQNNNCSAADLYNNVGQMKKGAQNMTYYKKRDNKFKNVQKFGYRLMFDFEDPNDYDLIEEPNPPTVNDGYIYQLNDKELRNRLITEVLTIINNKDDNAKFEELSNGQEKLLAGQNVMSSRLDMLSKIQEEMPKAIAINMGVDGLNKRERLLNIVHQALEDKDFVALLGPRGVGKTQMASKIADKWKESGFNVVWIDGSSETMVNVSFRSRSNLTRWFLNPGFLYDVQDVLKFYWNKKCLFIFDGVRSLSEVVGFFPVGLRVHVLITSRVETFQHHEELGVFHLGPLTSDEGSEFVKRSLDVGDDMVTRELVETLGGLPLALQLAVANIRTRRHNSQLQLYDLEVADFLKDFRIEMGERDHTEVLDAVITLSLKSVRRGDWLGEVATVILDLLVYFPPNDLPVKLFNSLKLKDVAGNDLHDRILKLLKRHSLLMLSDDSLLTVSMPHQVQEYIRRSLEPSTLKLLLRFVLNHLRHNNDLVEEPHIMSVWEYAVDHPILVTEFVWSRYKGGNTILHLLAIHGCKSTIVKLLANIPDDAEKKKLLEKMNDAYWSPMNFAFEFGHLDLMGFMLEYHKIYCWPIVGNTLMNVARNNRSRHEMIKKALVTSYDVFPVDIRFKCSFKKIFVHFTNRLYKEIYIFGSLFIEMYTTS